MPHERLRRTPARAPRPLVPTTPAAASGVADVLALQALVGNRRTATLLQRQNTPTPVPAPAPTSSEIPPFTEEGRPLPPALGQPALTPAQQAQLQQATTTLGRVPPLAEGDAHTLAGAIPGAAVFDLIRGRDAKRATLEEKAQALTAAKLSVGTQPEHGVPFTQEQVDALADEIATLTGEVENEDKLIAVALEPLGIQSEAQLVELVTVRFPDLFVERGKQLAITELESNRAIAEEELNRYGLNACVDPAARNALVGAARDLVDRDRKIAELETELRTANEALAPLPGGLPDPAVASANQAKADDLTKRLGDARRARTERHAALALQHPLLLRDIDLAALASGDEAQLDAVAGETLRGILRDIDTTKEKVASGALKVWNLSQIVALTKQDLGVGDSPVLDEVVAKRIQKEVSDEADLKIAVAALSITAGLIATFATGGLALAAGGVALGAGAFTASESVQAYLTESAAGNVALDPALADLSKNEPELGWMILDLVGVGLDVGQVVAAVKQLGKVAKAASAAEDAAALEDFAREARRVLPPAAATKVMSSLSRRFDGGKKVERTIRAIKAKFRKRDLRAVARHLDRIAEQGFRGAFQNLRRQGRVRPLNRAGLEAALGKELAEELIAAGRLKDAGFYHPHSGMLFIKDGGLDAFTSTVVHETTHWMQHKQIGPELADFLAEFQAFAMERQYLQSLVKSTGKLPEVSPEDLKLLSATDEDIALRVEKDYGLKRPENFDGAPIVLETLQRMGVHGR